MHRREAEEKRKITALVLFNLIVELHWEWHLWEAGLHLVLILLGGIEVS